MNTDLLLNAKWRNYFNWTVIIPTIGVFVFLLGLIIVALTLFSVGTSAGLGLALTALLGGSMIMAVIGIIVGSIIYVIWFIIATDTLFQLLGVDRMIGNILNLVGLFIFPGVSLFVLPIYFWIKMRDYWLVKGQRSSWRAVAY